MIPCKRELMDRDGLFVPKSRTPIGGLNEQDGIIAIKSTKDYLVVSEEKVKQIVCDALLDNNSRLLRPIDCSDSNYRERFSGLVEQWEAETGHFSTSVDMFFHPKYQQIIGMGPKVIPLLLKELKDAPGHWFWALKSITGEDPVPQEKKGCIGEMAKAWLEWGEENGYDF